MVYYAKIGQNPQGPYQEPTLLRKIIALYAFNTAVVEVPRCPTLPHSSHARAHTLAHLLLPLPHPGFHVSDPLSSCVTCERMHNLRAALLRQRGAAE